MSTPDRRGFVKLLLSLPVVSSLAGLPLFSQSGSTEPDMNSPEFQFEYLAVRILRHINTAQAWHKNDKGVYASLETLLASDSMARLLADERVDKMGVGASLHRELNFSRPEIVPGWKFAFTAYPDKSGYLVVMSPVSSSVSHGFSTDEVGIIYKGHALDTVNGEGTAGARNALRNAAYIDHRKSNGMAVAFLKRTMFYWICACKQCIGSYPCCCDPCCACQVSCAGCPNGCVDCGCVSCVFCCIGC